MIVRKTCQLFSNSMVWYSFSRSISSTSPLLVDKLPRLTEFPRFVVPKLSHSLRNWFISKTLITPYFDNDFSIKEFSSGAKHAATTVANSLAEGELDPLNNYLSPECLDLVSKNIR